MQKKGRVYKVGKLIEIPAKVVSKILEWNLDDEKRGDLSYDRKICQSLVMSLVSKNDLLESNINKDVINFIEACFIVRCDDQVDERIAAIDTYIQELCATKASGK